MKVPQLRNLYRKTGFEDRAGAVNKRGFGFGHDGAIDDLFTFLQQPNFQFDPDTALGNAARRDLKAFLLSFDTGMAPAVGYQITFDGGNGAEDVALLDTLREQAHLGHCQVVAKGRVAGVPRSWDMHEADVFTPALLALAGTGAELTVTGVPPGTGTRIGLDRDRDQFFDAYEVSQGTDPADPGSKPSSTAVAGAPVNSRFEAARPNPFRERAELLLSLPRAQRVDLAIYDVMGRQVRTIVDGKRLAAGEHRLAWDGRRNDGAAAGAGVYFVRFRSEDAAAVKTLVRIR
jgi:hypothetical protein